MVKKQIKMIIRLPLLGILLIYEAYANFINLLSPKLRGFGRQPLIDAIDRDKKLVEHGGVTFWLHTPNFLCNYRHSTFSTKEPEILQWMDEYGGGVLYDIGANIGIYSLYYAQTNKGSVYSFEPSVFNLRQLVKNVSVNKLSNRVTIVPTPLSSETGISKFVNGSEDEGGALSAFGVDYGFDGKPLTGAIDSRVIGFTLDFLIKNRILPEKPSLIKIDVDGIEHLILGGAIETLQSRTLKSIYVEVNDDFEDQNQEVAMILENAGFTLKEKRQAPMFASTNVFNQIWVRR